MLGKWAFIDIETSGVDPSQDHVIDIGFIVFSEQDLIKECSYRIKTDVTLDPVIIALTGLTLPQIQKEGKSWEEIAGELEILQNAVLIAHNASFEESFLKSIFEKLQIQPQMTDSGRYFHDSLDVFPFLLPYFPRLGLESINQIFKLWAKEKHQGLEDSKDLADALLYAHSQMAIEKRIEICEYDNISSWWKKWLSSPLNYEKSKKPTLIHKVMDESLSTNEIKQWTPEYLTAFANSFPDKHEQWLSLKLIQMMGRGISGIISITKTSILDLEIIYRIGNNYLKNFRNKKLVLCTSYYSPDESFWFMNNIKTLSVEEISCEIFKKHALEVSKLLDEKDQLWSKDLLRFYANQNANTGLASRIPDLWCRQEPVIDVLWKTCRYVAKKKIIDLIKNNTLEDILVLQPQDLDLLLESNDVTTIFWLSKQLEWNNDFNVEKIKYFDYEHILIVCSLLEKMDSENQFLINDAKKLFEEFNLVLISYINNQQELDQKRIFWDVDFSELSRKHLSDWKNKNNNFLARRKNLKKYQSELIDALWSQIDHLLEQMLKSCSNHSFGLSWKAGTEKIIWELWNWQIQKLNYSGAKIFVDYEFDDESKEYWNFTFGLNQIEKNKRFDKIQMYSDEPESKNIPTVIWDDVQVPKLLSQIKELSTKGRILFCSQDQATSSNIFSALVKENYSGLATWSDFMRGTLSPLPQIVFCWDKDFRYSALKEHLWLNFDYLILDRVPDLAWFAWAQAAWKSRVKSFSSSAFEAYWCRRAGMLREKYLPMAKLANVKEIIVFDSRKNKWKGDSWKILSSYIS
jgi:DNA polymerase III epsilon subunit-like protein